MNISTFFFHILDSQKGYIRVGNLEKLTGKEAALIRSEINELADTKFEKIYLDAKDVLQADLSGINEIIHTHYFLENVAKKLVLIYRKGSAIEKWVLCTGLDRFVETAILPKN